MIRRPPRSTQSRSSAASDVYKRQVIEALIKATNIGEAPDEIKASFRASVNVKRHMFDLEDWPKEIEGISGIPSINLALAAKNITDTFFSIALKLSLIHISEPT